MNLHPREKRFYRDETGMRIEEGDLLKVFHFIGRGKKRYWMYHIAILEDFKGQLFWAGKEYHAEGNKGHYRLMSVADKQNGIIPGYTVISKKSWEMEDALRKEAKQFWKQKLKTA
jgi:hypothetical protein